MNLSLQSQLTLYPLTIRQDKKHYIVEENLSGDFFEMPKICIDAIQMINNGVSLGTIEKELTHAYPDEEVDLIDFAQQLLELGLIKEIDGEPLQIIKQNRSPGGFKWISPKVGRLFFNNITMKFYGIIFIINILFLLANPQLIPNYQALFPYSSMVLNALTFMGITLVLIIIHEFGHVLAVRSYNLPAKLEVGHRLFFVVFQTDLSPAWKLQPNQRNRLFMAGLCFEQIIIFIVLSIKMLFPEIGTFFAGVLSIIVFDILVKTIYQCCFYMKTDLYYLCENITGCYNLMENGKRYLSKWLPFLKTESTTETFAGEDRFVRFYSLFYILGITLTIGLFVFYFIPQAFYAYSQVLPELLRPGNNPYFWDAVVFLGQSVVMISLLLYSWMKNRLDHTR